MSGRPPHEVDARDLAVADRIDRGHLELVPAWAARHVFMEDHGRAEIDLVDDFRVVLRELRKQFADQFIRSGGLSSYNVV